MTTKYYDPAEVNIVVAGLIIKEGFAEDSMIKVVRTAALYESQVGVDGQVTRVRIRDERATITITLMSTSDANDKLNAYAKRDAQTPNGAGVGSFLLQDLQGRTKLQSTACWVSKMPEVEFAKKATPRTWELEVAKLTGDIGGN